MQGAVNRDSNGLGLGLDAGGTQTRWALANAAGVIEAEGSIAGLSALQMATAEGRAAIAAALAELARQLAGFAAPVRVRAGFTGLGASSAALTTLLAGALRLPPAAITISTDIEIAYLDLFEPGEGYLVYAGTGSIAAYVDKKQHFHRAGGRGALLDDGGGGYWIAREALRHIWRLEDEQPGAWHGSPMARAVFDQIGGADWDHSRHFMYDQGRGEVGRLALAVAASASDDPAARAILHAAGNELARLALALISRYGMRPVALSGRAAQLHRLLESSFRNALPAEAAVQVRAGAPHFAAARLAARGAPALAGPDSAQDAEPRA